MRNVILVGDSIFDNGVYVQTGQAVENHLTVELPEGTKVTLLAIDGSVTSQAVAQLEDLPSNATHVFVSTGGNDALQAQFELFGDGGLEAPSVLKALTAVLRRFSRDYRGLMEALERLALPTTVCTIYDSIPGLSDTLRTALSGFNDVIVQEAARKGYPLIDLRCICVDKEDYAEVSPIEPSEKGGKKIAQSIALVVNQHDFDTRRTVIYC